MTRFTWLAWAVIAALILSVGTACKKRGAVASSVMINPVPAATTESGWPLYEVPAEGFALSLPANWRQFDMNPKTFDAKYNEAMKQDPQLAQMLGNLRQQLSAGCRFFGFDQTTAGTGFATNANVIRLPLPPGGSLDAIVAASLMQLESSPTIGKPIAHERIKIAAGECERLRYKVTFKAPNGQSSTVAITQYVLVKDGDGFSVTLTTLPDQEAKYAPIFEKIGASFRFVKRVP